jgi:nitrogen fixation/metabolism regulation signal transduction histidine kinase
MRRADGPVGQSGVESYSRDLGGIRMEDLSAELRETRRLVDTIEARDLRRGFTLALLVLLGAAWLVSLAPLVIIADRISNPIQQLTAALSDFAAGDWARRIDTPHAGDAPRDEVGRAVDAFNRMADQLEESRDRLVHLARMASWQSLARKTAHELKNSLTPIRLTVEEMQARHPGPDHAFVDQAVQIVINEIESLERRVRAAGEPGGAGRERARQRAADVAAPRASRHDVRSQARRPAPAGTRVGGPAEGRPDESAPERG